uniref:Uncharacterized protein n=1 Tax=Knipowitschia caucasica TaxID=637954 RepID=A0AAV2M4E4_KNICA
MGVVVGCSGGGCGGVFMFEGGGCIVGGVKGLWGVLGVFGELVRGGGVMERGMGGVGVGWVDCVGGGDGVDGFGWGKRGVGWCRGGAGGGRGCWVMC